MDRLAATVMVFDLDDTLYPEEDYVQSGMARVSSKIAEAFGIDTLGLAQEGWRDRGDWLSAVCTVLPDAVGLKDSLLWAYRSHSPTIRLQTEMQDLVEQVQQDALGWGIVTDGRALTQRLKLRALGLSDWPAWISDDHGGLPKPDPTRFEAIMSRFGPARYVYVADNPFKDFHAPLTLGWQTIGFEGFVSRPVDDGSDARRRMPHVWVDTPQAVLDAVLES